MKKLLVLNILLICALAACAMPTKPSQITGIYVSPVKYADYSCKDLITELASLSRRENQLVIAQKQRYSSSQWQAFWIGYGDGDGIEASELANVRGERNSVVTMIDKKECEKTE